MTKNKMTTEEIKEEYRDLLQCSYEEFSYYLNVPAEDGGRYTYAIKKDGDNLDCRLSYIEYLVNEKGLRMDVTSQECQLRFDRRWTEMNGKIERYVWGVEKIIHDGSGFVDDHYVLGVYQTKADAEEASQKLTEDRDRRGDALCRFDIIRMPLHVRGKRFFNIGPNKAPLPCNIPDDIEKITCWYNKSNHAYVALIEKETERYDRMAEVISGHAKDIRFKWEHLDLIPQCDAEELFREKVREFREI